MGSPGLRLIKTCSVKILVGVVVSNEVSKPTSSVHVSPGDYISPGDLDYDRQVLRVERQITFTSVVPITSYPNMSVPDAIAYEHELGMAEVIEVLQFVDEQENPGGSVDLRTHVYVRRVVD